MEITFKPALPKGYKRFCCDRCGFQFIKKVTSPISRCLKCEWGLIALGYRNRGLDVYSEMKLYWLRNPRAWEDNIKRRSTVNRQGGNSKQTYLNDSFGHRMGAMPEAVEI